MADSIYTVCIIDDEESICANYLDFFEDTPQFSAIAHPSAESALESLEQGFCPDACIVDMRLPGMRGDMFIAKARILCPDCRFLISTGSLDATLSPMMKQMLMTEEDIVYKPTDMLQVVARLEQLLGIDCG